MKTFSAALVLISFPFLSGAAAADRVGTTFPVVDTGQTKCYDTGRNAEMWSCPSEGQSFFGQDGNYTINPPSYTDNGDGTITDNVTGLMWEKNFRRNVVWREAPDVAAGANTGGHADWRVPTIKELYSLMNFAGATGSMGNMSQVPRDAVPYLDKRYFEFEYPTQSGSSGGGGQSRFIDAQYITSTAYRGYTMGGNATFFGVNFADGRIKGYPQRGRGDGKSYYLRLVRGNPEYGRNAFRDNRDGTVGDRATGLTWMLADSGDAAYRQLTGANHYKDGRMDWPEALKFCETLDFAGAGDWRLPNAKELQGILDYSRSPQSTQSAAIDPVFGVTPITDEGGKPNYPGYWASTTHLDGRYPGTDAVVVYFGEALGTGGSGGQGMGGPGGGGRQMPGSEGSRDRGPGMQGPGGGPGMQGGMPGGGMRQRGGPGMRRGPGGGEGMQGRPPRPGQFGMQGPGGPGMQGGGMRQGGGRQQPSSGNIMDVHGAGAQRGDPKIGNPDDYPKSGQGPQGDVRRVYNYVRCVRTAG
ncbi:MAG: DUF1566 domain-containing protein [Rhodospirillales bacterium]|nr:DUF1566 domain-containing protein [Rhodospirillales bacterium]